MGGNVHTGEHENCGRHNIRKHREIKDGEKYITLEISLNFGSLDKMKITSSEPNDYLGISGKLLITSLGINTIRISKKRKNSRYAIKNISLKGIYNIINESEDFPYEGYVRKRSKHVPTDSQFYPPRHLSKCIMIFNMCDGPISTQ